MYAVANFLARTLNHSVDAIRVTPYVGDDRGSSMLGIINNGPGIGDKIQFSSFPENYFRNTGEKVVDLSKCEIFDHNPYVVRDQPHDAEYDLWKASGARRYLKHICIPSIAQRTLSYFNPAFTCYLRHFRLYFNEQAEMNPRQIVVHFAGKTVNAAPLPVIQQIRRNYKNFEIHQVGTDDDPYYDCFINSMGLPFWDSVKMISESMLFIGVSSSMMNVALCYPRVGKRVVLDHNYYDLPNVIPMDSADDHLHWLDHGIALFNGTERDMGVTYSYTKI